MIMPLFYWGLGIGIVGAIVFILSFVFDKHFSFEVAANLCVVGFVMTFAGFFIMLSSIIVPNVLHFAK